MIRTQIAKARSDESGFTLIELLIVIVVLGVLAGIVVFGVGTFREDSQLSACKADLKNASIASDAYNAKNGTFVDLAGLVTAKLLKSSPPASELIVVSGTTGVASSTYPGCTL